RAAPRAQPGAPVGHGGEPGDRLVARPADPAQPSHDDIPAEAGQAAAAGGASWRREADTQPGGPAAPEQTAGAGGGAAAAGAAAAGAAAAGAAAAGLWRRFGEDDDPGRPEAIGSTGPERAGAPAAGGNQWLPGGQNAQPGGPATASSPAGQEQVSAGPGPAGESGLRPSGERGQAEPAGAMDPEQAGPAAAGDTDLWGRPRPSTSPGGPAEGA